MGLASWKVGQQLLGRDEFAALTALDRHARRAVEHDCDAHGESYFSMHERLRCCTSPRCVLKVQMQALGPGETIATFGVKPTRMAYCSSSPVWTLMCGRAAAAPSGLAMTMMSLLPFAGHSWRTASSSSAVLTGADAAQDTSRAAATNEA
jgi:hypothetical protein